MVINANELERQKQHPHQRRRSSIVLQQGQEEERSEASSVRVSGGEGGGEHRSKLSGCCVDAEKEDAFMTPPRTELQHQRGGSSRSSGNYSGYSSNSNVTGGRGSARGVDVGVSQELSLSSEELLKGGPSPCQSPVGAEEEEDEEDEDDEDDVDQDGLAEESERFGSIEGLKWGEFVQFKLPREDEVRTRKLFVGFIELYLSAQPYGGSVVCVFNWT